MSAISVAAIMSCAWPATAARRLWEPRIGVISTLLTMNVAVEMRNSAPTSTAVLLYWFMSSFIGRCCVLMGEVVIFVSFSLVFVFVCVISVLLLQVLLRCFLEPSHNCFLTSNTCGESDRLLDSRHDRVAGTSKRELSGNVSAGPLATLDDACHDWDWKH